MKKAGAALSIESWLQRSLRKVGLALVGLKNTVAKVAVGLINI